MATSYLTSDLVKGNSIFLYVNANPVAFSKSVDLSISADSIDVTSKMSGNWKQSIAGLNSYSINSDFLYTTVSGDTNFTQLFDIQATGGTVDFVLGLTTDLTTFAMTKGQYSGKAFIKSLSLKAGDTDLATCSVSLDGNGALTKVMV